MIDILGKNASIDSFPPQFFDDRGEHNNGD